MLFPIGDDNRKIQGPAWVSMTLLAANIAVFVFLQGCGANETFTYGYSVIPYEIVTGQDLVQPQTVPAGGGEYAIIPQAPGPFPIFLTILTAMFMHGGLGHIGGNMLYLWIFGDNVEHRFGALPFLALYLACGVAATIAQILLDPTSVIPNLGASGAISGVLGAYMVLFPRNKVHALFFYTVVSVPAVLAIGLWIAMQLISGWGSIVNQSAVGGVAYGAHIGGFVAGVLLALVMRGFIREEPDNPFQKYAVYDRSRRLW
ncbi:MAG: rhomboid family intramembrane serine protease [Rhodothermales bacterium]